eukprot:2224836-Rhodomonas_salina.1
MEKAGRRNHHIHLLGHLLGLVPPSHTSFESFPHFHYHRFLFLTSPFPVPCPCAFQFSGCRNLGKCAGTDPSSPPFLAAWNPDRTR